MDTFISCDSPVFFPVDLETDNPLWDSQPLSDAIYFYPYECLFWRTVRGKIHIHDGLQLTALNQM